MRTGFSKALWLISGILLVFAGVLAMVYPVSVLLSLSFVFGLVMLIAGIFSLIIFVFTRGLLFGAGWILADGLITTLLGVYVLSNQMTASSVIPYIFGMWIMFSGVMRFISSFDAKKLGVSGWYWLTLIGILCMALGFASLLKPIIAAALIGIMMGIIFIFQGVASIFMCWLVSQLPPADPMS